MKPEVFAAWWVIVRDILFVVAGIGWLTVDIWSATHGGESRKWTWVIAGGLTVLPVFTHRDRRDQQHTPDDEPAKKAA